MVPVTSQGVTLKDSGMCTFSLAGRGLKWSRKHCRRGFEEAVVGLAMTDGDAREAGVKALERARVRDRDAAIEESGADRDGVAGVEEEEGQVGAAERGRAEGSGDAGEFCSEESARALEVRPVLQRRERCALGEERDAEG